MGSERVLIQSDERIRFVPIQLADADTLHCQLLRQLHIICAITFTIYTAVG